MGIRELALMTGLSVGEMAAAKAIGLYDQRIAQGLKPRNKSNGFKESMPSHKDPKDRDRRKPRGTPGTFRAIMVALGRGDEINIPVKALVPFARRNRIRIDRIKAVARRKKLKNK